MSERRAGAGEGPDAEADSKHEEAQPEESTKTQDAAEAGRRDFDVDASQG